MKIPENRKQLEEFVLRYLYDDLDDEQRAVFERELSDNAQLQLILSMEQNLERTIPRGTSVYIDDDRLEDNRRLVRRRLQRLVAHRPAAGEFLIALLHRPSLAVLQIATLAICFALGFVVAGATGTESGAGDVLADAITPLGLVGEQDYEISELNIERFDPVSGDIDLSFAIASDTRLRGNVSDAGIRTLMTVALLNEIDEAARLDTVEALQSVSNDNLVSASMIYVLTNDGNPGVRYSAVRSLVNHVDDERVESALRNALQQDVNPGVRVEAFNALARNPDSDTLMVFRQAAEVDGNDYIRQRARAIIETTQSGLNNSEIF